MRKLLGILMLVSGLALAQQGEVRVAVSANFRDAFNDIARAFSKTNPGVRVVPSFGSSGAFTQQIVNGAPFDLFLAADTSFPRALEAQGLVEPATLRVYARGKLVLFVPSRSGLQAKSLEVLRDPRVTRIAIANPETAPYGKAAMQAIKAYGLYQAVQNRLVFAQDIAQAAQLTLAAADAGLIAYSALFTPAFQGKGSFFIVPQRLYDPLDQGMVLVKGRARPEVRAFYEFLQSATAQQIIKAYGYQVTASAP